MPLHPKGKGATLCERGKKGKATLEMRMSGVYIVRTGEVLLAKIVLKRNPICSSEKKKRTRISDPLCQGGRQVGRFLSSRRKLGVTQRGTTNFERPNSSRRKKKGFTPRVLVNEKKRR